MDTLFIGFELSNMEFIFIPDVLYLFVRLLFFMHLYQN